MHSTIVLLLSGRNTHALHEKVKFSFKDYIRKHAVFWSFTPEYCMFSDVILKGKLHFFMQMMQVNHLCKNASGILTHMCSKAYG